MKQTKLATNSKEIGMLAAQGMQEKKGKNILLLDLTQVHQAVADYFVICSGGTHNQVDAIADSVEDAIYKATGEHPWRKEGRQNGEWIIIDYSNVVVHVFRSDRRAFYALEDLWGDARITAIESEKD
ncbi:ribosome silencing factor [Eisenibacter elegans]|jgi:ribosome-associated protein|uniref:ribosome silencing factor n=1 Tax=Eisenibacter elegans TaxID=997 RepID=UPI00041AA491|nr:ribosome silencing factor [Eisenibacter elegans]